MINNKSDKPFFDHLEELRQRVIKCFFSIFLFSILSYYFSNHIITFLINPVEDLKISFQVLKITSIFLIKISLSLIFGILLSLPIILYQFLVFILPAFENKVTINKIFKYLFVNILCCWFNIWILCFSSNFLEIFYFFICFIKLHQFKLYTRKLFILYSLVNDYIICSFSITIYYNNLQ